MKNTDEIYALIGDAAGALRIGMKDGALVRRCEEAVKKLEEAQQLIADNNTADRAADNE